MARATTSSDLFVRAPDTLASAAISRDPVPVKVVGLGFNSVVRQTGFPQKDGVSLGLRVCTRLPTLVFAERAAWATCQPHRAGQGHQSVPSLGQGTAGSRSASQGVLRARTSPGGSGGRRRAGKQARTGVEPLLPPRGPGCYFKAERSCRWRRATELTGEARGRDAAFPEPAPTHFTSGKTKVPRIYSRCGPLPALVKQSPEIVQGHTRFHRTNLSERTRRRRRGQLDPGPSRQAAMHPQQGLAWACRCQRPGPAPSAPAPPKPPACLPPCHFPLDGKGQSSQGQDDFRPRSSAPKPKVGGSLYSKWSFPVGCVTARKDTDTLREGQFKIKERKRVGPLDATGPFATRHVIGTLGKLGISPVDSTIVSGLCQFLDFNHCVLVRQENGLVLGKRC